MPKCDKLFVIGNPPYQIQSDAQKNISSLNTSQAMPLYHTFIETIIDFLKPTKFSMIVPSRWMSGGVGLDDFRNRMKKDNRFRKIVHFSGENTIFPEVTIKGGVNYFLWQKDYKGLCEFVSDGDTANRDLNKYEIVVVDNNAISILDKILTKTKLFMSSRVYSRNAFGISTDFDNWSDVGIPCISIGNEEHNISKQDFSDSNNIKNKWKVCTSKAGDGGFSNVDSNGQCSVLGRILIIDPGKICTETYIVVSIFNTKAECENLISYINTKFFRFVLGQRVQTQDINKEKFSFVPDQQEYLQAYTDAYIYKKYNLTPEEIAYIERKIK